MRDKGMLELGGRSMWFNKERETCVAVLFLPWGVVAETNVR